MRNVSRLVLAASLGMFAIASPLLLAGCGDSSEVEDLAAPDLSAHDGAHPQPDLTQNNDGGPGD